MRRVADSQHVDCLRRRTAPPAQRDRPGALDSVNAELRQKGPQGLDMGIGTNTAEVVAGNFGSPQRLNYTVVGDGVNLASRLEGLTTRPGIGAHHCIGRTEPVALFAMLAAAKDAGGARPPARMRVVSDG